MRYGVVINMDYPNHSHRDIAGLYRRIRDALKKEGFRMDGRVFTIERPAEQAGALAQRVLEELDGKMEGSLYSFIREFYGFAIGQVEDLSGRKPPQQGTEPVLVIEEIRLASNPG